MSISIANYRPSTWLDRSTSLNPYQQKDSPSSNNERQKDTITISQEARDKLTNEQTDDNSKNGDVLDKLIDNIKENIKALQAQLKKLANDNSERAEQERKMIQQKITTLNAVLIDLLGEKLANSG